MGTVHNGVGHVFRTIVEAARAHPRFQLVLALGSNLDTREIGPLPGNAIVVRHAPQIEIFKRTAVCITHAGLNTVLEALGQGVPMVAIPAGTDQPGTAARVAHTRTGVVVPFAAVTAPALLSALAEVLGNPEYRRNAARMQAAIRAANGLHRAADILEEAFKLERGVRPPGAWKIPWANWFARKQTPADASPPRNAA